MHKLITKLLALGTLVTAATAQACTGITLESQNHDVVAARSIEWGTSVLKTELVQVPRQHRVKTQTADGIGMTYTTQFGFVGLSIEDKNFVVEGLNEKGLSAGLFFFLGYGRYPAYDPKASQQTISDMEFVAWVLGNCQSVAEAKNKVKNIRIANRYKEAGTVHYRIADKTGAQIVIEIVNGQMQIFDNRLGVLTNSPGFEWQITNLNNYMNLKTGHSDPVEWGKITLRSTGMGSGMAGLPGDITPPSRFVRAALMTASAPNLPDAEDAVLYSFKILNSFEIPIGLELTGKENPTGLLSATQWTSAIDMTNAKIYFKTMNDARIRCIDLKDIDFGKVSYSARPIDNHTTEPIENITFN